MYQAEDLGFRAVLEDCLEAGLVVMQIFLQLSRLHIKHVDEDLDIDEAPAIPTKVAVTADGKPVTDF